MDMSPSHLVAERPTLLKSTAVQMDIGTPRLAGEKARPSGWRVRFD